MKTAVAVPFGSSRALSPMQRGLLASQLKHPDAPVQNMPLLSHLADAIDARRLAEAFDSVVAASDALRTTVDRRSGAVTLIDADHLPPTAIVRLPKAEVEAWARARGRAPLDVSVCGYDSAIAVHEDETASWYLDLHHVITDATSSALVFEATAAAYFGELPGPSANGDDRAERSYYGWARKLAANLARPADRQTERAIDHWERRAPAPRVGRLYRAIDHPTPTAERIPLDLRSDLLGQTTARLAGDYRMLTEDLAWSTLLVTATALYCHRLTGTDRFAIGLPVHNRSDPAVRRLIGPTMEVFPVDIEIEPDDTFRTLHKRVGRSILDTLRHAAPGTSPSPDYEMVVNVIPRAVQQQFGSIPATTRWLHSGAIDGSHLLRVQMTSYAAGADTDPADHEFALDLNHGAADAEHRARAAGHYLAVLSDLVTDPDRPIGAATLCDQRELAELRRWESGPEPPTSGEPVVERLRRALADSTEVVVEDGERHITGRELWQWIAATASWLAERGVGPGRRVGLDLPRSAEAVTAIMAVMAAGASFVPLDPSQPKARRKRLATMADCVVVLSSIDDIAARRPDPAAPSRRFEPVERSGSDEAYVIFTSGSTGEPKGVPITRSGLAGYLSFAEESYLIGVEPPVAPLFSPLTFDLTITTLFLPILAGGRLVIIGADGPQGLSEIAEHREITWCKATPSHLELLVRLLPTDHRLETLVVGGEAFGSRLAAALLAHLPDLAIFNEYGPTEAVVGCMIYRVEPELLDRQPEVPIGRPAPGVSLAVVDEYLQRVPFGASGELCIAHDGLTVGYLESAADEDPGPGPSDAASADDSPFVEIDGRRYYRSGDLVRLQDATRLVYLGRKDEQVKVGGVRLEPIEVEEALNAHPAVDRSAVRLWSPAATEPRHHCPRCGLPDNVPGVEFDLAGVCGTCHAFDRVAPIAESWFKTPGDLRAKQREAAAARTGDYDCVHLLSGGKDSTYALYRLVEYGFRPFALTLDNGFISEGAKENVRRSVTDLGIDHEFVTVESMNEIFRDSLERHSNVCHGCYKTIYTVATNRAAELGAPLIVTGLSRGQLFETRLIPQQFSADRFDPEAIDRAVLEARKHYHRLDDGPNRLLDTEIFADDGLFERIEYLDFYRYVDVELGEMLRFLDQRAPWIRPADTGRSTNCLVNAAGIHTHQTEQGYHNYAVPYAWDVRLGHKTRDEAIEELDDQLDLREVDAMLSEIGYRPRPRQVLTAWIEPAAGVEQLPSPGELRAFLAESLPTHAVPSAFVAVELLPLTANGKLDGRALPAPKRVHRPGPTLQLAATTETERSVIAVWERILQVEPIGPTDDFFAIGGDSLAALEMIVALGDRLGLTLPEDLAFTNTSVGSLAEAVDLLAASARERPGGRPDDIDGHAATARDIEAYATPSDAAPVRSAGELAVLFDQANRPDDIMYNVGRQYVVDGPIDPTRFERALRTVAERHQPLSWSHGTSRRRLSSVEAVELEAAPQPIPIDELHGRAATVHRAPFDLDNGPLLRCLVQPIDDGSTAVVLAIHHASGDAGSFQTLWRQLDEELSRTDGDPGVERLDYAGFCAWQEAQLTEDDRQYWLDAAGEGPAAELAVHRPSPGTADGFLTRPATVGPAELRSGSGVSAAALALSAVAGTVRAYSDGPEIEIGLITSTRNSPAADRLFGYFLNSLPIRLRWSGEQTMARLAEQAATAIGTLLPHRTYPLSRIVADRREAGMATPELNVLMAFDELDTVALEGRRTEQRVLSNGCAVVPLTFFFEVRDDRVDISLEHRGSVVDHATATAMLDTLDVLLTTAVRRGGAPADLAVEEALTDVGSAGLLVAPDVDDLTPVLSRILEQLNRSGDATAVSCGSEILTWAELADRAAAIALLLDQHGVGRGDRVALCLPRSTSLIAAVVGIHLAGAAYVPIDPTYPDDRIELIATRAGASVGLVAGDRRDLVADPLVVGREGIDGRRWDELERPAGHLDLPAGHVPSDDAYLIFTSGSTGQPRGVPVGHGQLTASTNARSSVYDRPPGRFLLLSSVAFDSSVVGLFWTLAEGGTVVLPTDDQAHDLGAIGELLESGITHTLMVPTLYHGLLADQVGSGSAPSAEHVTSAPSAEQVTSAPWAEQVTSAPWAEQVIVAGEACPPSLIESHFARHPDSALTNEYGPTEATVWATAHHCSPTDDASPIGPPIPGTWVAVVDDAGVVRPAGVEGELIIGGRNVVDGYLHDPQLTDARFGRVDPSRIGAVSDSPQLGDGRFFRTGDRATIVDGTVLYLGRRDNQLNVGGARAEPEEIEGALLTVDSITGAVVVAADLRSLPELLEALPADVVGRAMAGAAEADDPVGALTAELRAHGRQDLRLVAHVEAPAELDLASLRRAAAELLPPLLRPARYELHRQLPRTPNGKLDREAAEQLPVTTGPSPDGPTPDEVGSTEGAGPDAAAAPTSELIAELNRLFARALRADRFGPDDSFFDHGGHSLLAMELLLAVEEHYGHRLPAAALYRAPTPRQLAARLTRDRADDARSFLVPIQPNGGRSPIFAIHVLGVDCGFFRPLAARLGDDQPMYGLGQPTTDLDTTGPSDVGDVAAIYADEIDRVAPDGPVNLAAISLGGVVAYELAQQLIARGRDVALLALFDAFGPALLGHRPPVGKRLAAHFERATRDPQGYLRDQAAHQGERARRVTERIGLAASRRLNLRTDHQLEVRRFIEENVRSQAGYDYDPYPGRMLVLKAGDDPFARYLIERSMGWAELALGGLEVGIVPGQHLSMMAEPNVEHVADAMERALTAHRRGDGDQPPPAVGTDPSMVERLLIAGLRAGRLPATVGRLLRRPDLEPEGARLVADVDRLLAGVADTTRRTTDDVAARLVGAGIDAEPVPTPRRLQHPTATIDMTRRSGEDLRHSLSAATSVMAELDFQPVDSGTPAALMATARANGWIDYISRSTTTTRIRLRWADISPIGAGTGRLGRLRGRLAPNRSDFAAIELPGWAWPGYWPVRPLRLARDRMLRGPGSPRRPTTDLGIFLGTPEGLIAPLLEFAAVEPDQLVVDIGCGDGRVLVEAARRFGCRARGYEREGPLVDRARLLAAEAGVADRVEIVQGDATDYSVADADVVFAFLPPEAVASILRPVLDQLGPEARFLSHEQLGARLPVDPDRSGLVLGGQDDPSAGGITVANLWYGTRTGPVSG